MTVQFGPGDDSQRLYLNGGLVGQAGYGVSGNFDLGRLGAGDRVRIVDWNDSAGFVWDVTAYVDGAQAFRAQDGQVGSYGACGNAQTPTQAIVFDVTLDYRGTVLSQQKAC